ncbi:DUF4331 domain-containing protein [Luteimonas vadosa]|uniref:DUF4331 domain-containing protein n=1 Tax=Luteimonas vadosa TaxID=1165507 RepID=A0ABP9E2Q8_9GAMM
MKPLTLSVAVAAATALLAASALVGASSHREAPLITKVPKVDGTDFYMFRSYESGRAGYVTFLANYQPLQDAYGGPNYFLLDSHAVYAIHVDNNGDALPDISFEFEFRNKFKNLAVPVNGVDVAVPLSNIGSFSTPASAGSGPRNVVESYTVRVSDGGGRNRGKLASNLSSPGGGQKTFLKPFDNIGEKSIPNYARYAQAHIHDIGLPGCADRGRVFVGQRRDGFAVNLGRVFDLINLNPVGAPDSTASTIQDKNVTTIALEVPISCLTKADPIIGAWTTADLPFNGTRKQVSRLSAPLVNEVVIGLPDKDKFNASQPKDDGQFATYVTNPTLPELVEILFPGVKAPNRFPRTDLVAAFLTGIEGLNKPARVTPAEMMRLNTSIPPKAAAAQSNLGVLGGDTAGFPNGRRPGDDVVDIELRVAMGVLLSEADAPSGQLPYNDNVTVKATDFRNAFPYLNTPVPGARN